MIPFPVGPAGDPGLPALASQPLVFDIEVHARLIAFGGLAEVSSGCNTHLVSLSVKLATLGTSTVRGWRRGLPSTMRPRPRPRPRPRGPDPDPSPNMAASALSTCREYCSHSVIHGLRYLTGEGRCLCERYGYPLQPVGHAHAHFHAHSHAHTHPHSHYHAHAHSHAHSHAHAHAHTHSHVHAHAPADQRHF